MRAGSGTVIDYAWIEWGATGVQVMGVPVTVTHSTIRRFGEGSLISADGILIVGAGADGSLIQGNVIENLHVNQSDCIEVRGASPAIAGNTLRDYYFGLHLNRSNSLVNGNNVFTSNNFGIQVWGGSGFISPWSPATSSPATRPTCVYRDSARAPRGVKLDFTGNWWGTTNADVIASRILDLNDDYTSTTIPLVDFNGFLSSANGAPVSGQYIVGPITANTSLTGGVTYNVVGTLYVPSGKTLNVPAGVTLRFSDDRSLDVAGTLNVSGASGNPVTMTSAAATLGRGDWQGVIIRSSGSVVEYASIEWARAGVKVLGVPATVRNSTIRYFLEDGILVTDAGATGSTVEGNLIDNLNDTSDCLEVRLANVTVTGNTLKNCLLGLHLNQTNSVVSGNNIITGNDYGVQMWGGSSIYQPVVTGNQIYSNDLLNVRAQGFGAGASAVKLNYTGTGGGSASPSTIGQKIEDLADNNTATNVPLVDFSAFLGSAGGGAVPGII